MQMGLSQCWSKSTILCLCTGQFGVVYKATLVDKSQKNPTEVAVKTVYGTYWARVLFTVADISRSN